MSTGTLPQSLDVRKASQRGARLEALLAPAELPRLRALLAGDNGEIRAALVFARDEEQHYTVQVDAHACLDVRCERCLQVFQTEVHASSVLAAVWTDEQARALPAHLDPLIAAEAVVLRDLVEDELVLAMPMFSYHADRACIARLDGGVQLLAQPGDEPVGESKSNPFDVLAQLKRAPHDPAGD